MMRTRVVSPSRQTDLTMIAADPHLHSVFGLSASDRGQSLQPSFWKKYSVVDFKILLDYSKAVMALPRKWSVKGV